VWIFTCPLHSAVFGGNHSFIKEGQCLPIGIILAINQKKIFMDGTRFVLAGSLVDGRGAGVLRNVFIEVKEGIIISIGPAADLSCDNKTAIDDFSHCTIVPVLVDCSVSLTQSPSMDTRVHVSAEESDHAIRLAMLEQHIHYCHIHGVLGVADSDAITDLVDCYKKKNKKNIITIRSPRVF
jgi:hypothetical protein